MNDPEAAPANDLAVVLVAYHGDDWLPECLATLRRASRQRLRLILVDNAGNTGIESLDLGDFEARIVKPTHSLGFADANNFGLRFVPQSVQAVCFLNQDTKSDDGWLDECVRRLFAAADVGAVSPCISTYDGAAWDPNFRHCAARATDFPVQGFARSGLKAWYEVPELTAAALVVRHDVLRRVGPFDPVFGSYYEDYDLCRRIRRAGYRLGIAGQARVAHYSGSSTRDERAHRRRARLIVRNRVLYQMRCAEHRLPALLSYALYRFPYNLARSLWRTPSAQRFSTLVGGHLDLLPIWPRVVSQRIDEQRWQTYLDYLGWPFDGSMPEAASACRAVEEVSA